MRSLSQIKKGIVYSLIPARSGSKTITDKNIRMIGGHPLIAYSIAASKLSKKISRTIVSTDSERYGTIAKRYGAEVPFLRPDSLSQDDSADIDFIEHAIQWFENKEGIIPEFIVHLRPTAPIRNPQNIDDAIYELEANPEATSLRSGHLCVHPIYKWFKIKDGYGEPVFGEMSCDDANLPRQFFGDIMVPNGQVDVLRTEFIIKNHLLHGNKMKCFVTEQLPDIDTEYDLESLNVFKTGKTYFNLLQNYCDKMRDAK